MNLFPDKETSRLHDCLVTIRELARKLASPEPLNAKSRLSSFKSSFLKQLRFHVYHSDGQICVKRTGGDGIATSHCPGLGTAMERICGSNQMVSADLFGKSEGQMCTEVIFGLSK